MIENLLAEFKVGHRGLLESVNDIQPLLRSYPQAKPRLRTFETLLFRHFEIQSGQFFDRLEQVASENREKIKMVEFLREDLKEMKVKTLIFFDAHSGQMNDHHFKTFPKDFMDFSQM